MGDKCVSIEKMSSLAFILRQKGCWDIENGGRDNVGLRCSPVQFLISFDFSTVYIQLIMTYMMFELRNNMVFMIMAIGRVNCEE